jgi:hypothetical protein
VQRDLLFAFSDETARWVAVGFLASLGILAVSASARQVASRAVSLPIIVLRLSGILLLLWVRNELVRFVWLTLVFGALMYGSQHLGHPLTLIFDIFMIVVVLAIAAEWAANENHREAVVRGTVSTDEKSAFKQFQFAWPLGGDTPMFHTPVSSDGMPDLRRQALVSGALLFPIFSLLHLKLSGTVPASASVIEMAWTGWAYPLDRFLQTLPIDVLELMNWGGFSGTQPQRPAVSVDMLVTLDLAVGATFALVVINGIAKVLQISALSSEAAKVIVSNPELAIRLGPRAIDSLERRWEFPRVFKSDRQSVLKYIVDAVGSGQLSETDEADAIAALGNCSSESITPIQTEVTNAITYALEKYTSEDRRHEVIRACAVAAGKDKRDIRTAFVPLLQVACSNTYTTATRSAALSSVVGFREREARQTFKVLLKDRTQHTELRVLAVRGLAELRSWGSGMRSCFALLKSEQDSSVELAILQALLVTQIPSAQHKSVLTTADAIASDTSKMPAVRQAAMELVAALDPAANELDADAEPANLSTPDRGIHDDGPIDIAA